LGRIRIDELPLLHTSGAGCAIAHEIGANPQVRVRLTQASKIGAMELVIMKPTDARSVSFRMNDGGFMNTATIIEHLDAEITRLEQVRALLTDEDVRKGPGRPTASDAISKPVPVKRVMSAEGKKKIALAQKARWAKVRKAAKKAADTEKTVEKAVKPTMATATGKAVKKAAKT
jgi:hypothetical protein